MKKIFCIVLLLSVAFTKSTVQCLYDQPDNKHIQSHVDIRQFKGKKLLIIILAPGQVNTVTNEIAEFKNGYKGTVEIIGLTLPVNVDPAKASTLIRQQAIC